MFIRDGGANVCVAAIESKVNEHKGIKDNTGDALTGIPGRNLERP